MTRKRALALRAKIEQASASLPDEDALEAVELFPQWQIGKQYVVNTRFQYKNKLYRVIQPHTSQADWTPDEITALYTEVAKPGQGDSPTNPIIYNNNMELFKDKYYSQNDIVYICFRNTETPVYNDLKDLVGLYVNVYTD